MIKIEDIVKNADKLDKVPQQGALKRSHFGRAWYGMPRARSTTDPLGYSAHRLGRVTGHDYYRYRCHTVPSPMPLQYTNTGRPEQHTLVSADAAGHVIGASIYTHPRTPHSPWS
jgi:hypothetical protein